MQGKPLKVVVVGGGIGGFVRRQTPLIAHGLEVSVYEQGASSRAEVGGGGFPDAEQASGICRGSALGPQVETRGGEGWATGSHYFRQ